MTGMLFTVPSLTCGLAIALMLPVQAPVDFSGTWILDQQQSGVPEGPAQIHTIRQTAAELQIEVYGKTAVTQVYPLDGTERTSSVGKVTIKASTRWQGTSLVIDTVRTNPSPTGEARIETTETWSLASPDTLLVRRQSAVPGTGQITTLVYRRHQSD
jgi:hypothetical protein